jgi:hypothetical protein
MLMAQGRPARLHYLAGHFQVLTPGDHVICAISGEKIGIEDLRYWSVRRQEPYANAELALEAERKG